LGLFGLVLPQSIAGQNISGIWGVYRLIANLIWRAFDDAIVVLARLLVYALGTFCVTVRRSMPALILSSESIVRKDVLNDGRAVSKGLER